MDGSAGRDGSGSRGGSGEVEGWYAVRCVIRWRGASRRRRLYEERITLWRASDFDDAIARAETEAARYVENAGHDRTSPHRCLDLVQAYRIDEDVVPGDGVEVFSLLRSSDLGPRRYVNRFFATGDEHEQT
ncbi:MAG: hypothetical protein U0R68_16405 [Candidatus Nanopelagicales bacterium]